MYGWQAERDKDSDECPECEPGTMLNTVQVTDYRVWDFMKKDEDKQDWFFTEEDPLSGFYFDLPENFVPASGAITEDYILLDLFFGVEDLALKGAAKFAVVPFIVKGMGKGSARLWTSTKNLSSVKNAFAHWKKHGAEFPEFLNAKQYVEGAKKFLQNSPSGTLTKVRPNGEIVKYHPASNTFGVMSPDGTPKTMFRPDITSHSYPSNLDYFNAQ